MSKIRIKVFATNRPLCLEFAPGYFFCYNKWSISPESVDELSGTRRKSTFFRICHSSILKMTPFL